MKFFRRSAAAALAVAVATLVVLAVPYGASASADSRSATPTMFCRDLPLNPAQCLTDLDGNHVDAPVVVDSPYGSDSAFASAPVARCGGTVTAACPFSDKAFDTLYRGDQVDQISHTTQLCVAADGGVPSAHLGTCNSSSGYGGSDGTLFVDASGTFINVYWTDQMSGRLATCLASIQSYVSVNNFPCVGQGVTWGNS